MARILSDLRGTKQSALFIQPSGVAGPPTASAYRVGDHYTDLYGDIWKCTNPGTPGVWVPIGGCTVAGLSLGLVCQSVTTTTMSIAATQVSLKSSVGGARTVQAVAATLTCTAAGANGLDTGTVGASLWYYVYIIHNGTTTACLASLSPTAPTLPATYTHSGLVSAFRTTAASLIQAFFQQNHEVAILPTLILSSVGPTVANTYQTVSITAAVPVTAVQVSGTIAVATTATDGAMWVACDNTGLGQLNMTATKAATAVDPWGCAAPFRLLIKTSQVISWKGLTTGAFHILEISGFTL
jgi:tartrate dehydratase beta subunit/fumarate hydratase class I family protein